MHRALVLPCCISCRQWAAHMGPRAPWGARRHAWGKQHWLAYACYYPWCTWAAEQTPSSMLLLRTRQSWHCPPSNRWTAHLPAQYLRRQCRWL